MSNQDNEMTLDVSHCERLIMIITILYTQYEQGELNTDNMHVDWDNIDKLKEKCNVLPNDYQIKLAILESYRDD
ncbi:MAG TPA: hypothetical protein VJZ27_03805 [Aggregatilineales bacterium]|nr:hypothetical protein [Aggregatilineales bacterium]